jgi:hypothetical protein
MKHCLVCFRPLSKAYFLCCACGKSYDRALEKDVTIANIIRWAVTRALRFSKARTAVSGRL